MPDRKKILLTGASGRIGRTCFSALSEAYNLKVVTLKCCDSSPSIVNRRQIGANPECASWPASAHAAGFICV
jgi:dihydrodipicolinate reductase